MPAFNNKYSYKNGFSFSVPAQIVGETLEKISQKETVTAESFLKESRPKESPTHSLFEWDDKIAAEKYRLRQATTIINQIQVEVIVKENKNTSVNAPAFVNVIPKATGTKGIFVSFTDAMNNEEMRKTVLKNAISELIAFKNKYNNYQELAGVIDAINKLKIV